MAEGTSATVIWECGDGIVVLLDCGYLVGSCPGGFLSFLTGFLSELESGSLACLSGTIESLLGGIDLALEVGFLCYEGVVYLGSWGKVIGGPRGSGIMELLLGVNALLGNQGGGKDGSGSSSSLFWSGTDGSDVVGTQFLRSKGSGGVSLHSSGEGISGSNLRTSEWGNGLGEILKECTGTGEILAGSSDLLTSNYFPSGGSLEFLVGGGSECYLGALSGFSGTNGG